MVMNHLKLTQPILTCHGMYRSKTCTELKLGAFKTNNYKMKNILSTNKLVQMAPMFHFNLF